MIPLLIFLYDGRCWLWQYMQPLQHFTSHLGIFRGVIGRGSPLFRRISFSNSLLHLYDLYCCKKCFIYTECWSQRRAKLRAFPRHLAQENTQLSPSLIPTLGMHGQIILDR